MSEIKLRYYQKDSIDYAVSDLLKGYNPVIGLPTASGKSIVLCGLSEKIIDIDINSNVLVISHVKEILEQNISALEKYFDGIEIGVYSAGLDSKTINKITVASIQTAQNCPEKFKHFTHVIIDEAHRVGFNEETGYRKFLKEIDAQCIGLTATPFRTKGGYLHEGDNALFDTLCIDLTRGDEFIKLIEEGYLSEIYSKKTMLKMDVSGIKTLAGDFATKDLSKKLNRQNITEAAVLESIHFGKKYHHWLCFAIDIKHADNIAERFNFHGISAIAVHSKMDGRDQAIKDFKNGKYKVLVNVDILIAGFDFPSIDMIISLRPTKSPIIHVQSIGRGLRVVYADGFCLNEAEGRLEAIENSNKNHCIASGQKVLTDKGLINIENVKLTNKIWDGIEFVNHGGLIYKGEQSVITYKGLTATTEHKVWTEEGWTDFGKCKKNGIDILHGRIHEPEIKNIICSFTDSDKNRWLEKESSDNLSILRNCIFSRFIKFNALKIWLQKMRKYKIQNKNTKMDNVKSYSNETKMRKQKRSTLQRLWRKGDKIQFQFYSRMCRVFSDYWPIGRNEALTSGQNKKQWSLSEREFKNCFSKNKPKQYEKKESNTLYAQIQNYASRSKIFGCNDKAFDNRWADVRPDKIQILQSIKKETVDVWDIINCGSRNRFSCQGLIVSNCLVLDFGGNTKRLGPINNVQVRKAGKRLRKGEIFTKTCPKCQVENALCARVCCNCYHEFETKEKIESRSSDIELVQKKKPEKKKRATKKEKIYGWAKVSNVSYRIYNKNGHDLALIVDYKCGLLKYSEYVFLAGHGYSRYKAINWIRQRWSRIDIECPTDINSCIKYQEYIRKPQEILLDATGKNVKVLDSKF